MFDAIRQLFLSREEKRAITYASAVEHGYVLRQNLAGIAMTSEKLLSIPAFFCGVRHISDCMATLPIRVKKEVAGGGREIAQSHWLNDLFRSPNHYMSWYDYLSWSITQLCVYNNSYSQIERMENGRTSELYPVPANFVQTLWQMPERTPKYNIMQSPTTEFASQMDGYYMLHLKGITLDGVAGMNPLLYASDNTRSRLLWTNTAPLSSGTLVIPLDT